MPNLLPLAAPVKQSPHEEIMSLNNRQYNEILRMYDHRLLQDRYELDLRKKEVFRRVPELQVLEQRLASDSVQWAKSALFGNAVPNSELQESNRAITEHKLRLLTGAGYPADYLSMVYQCPDCKDTGYIGTGKCHCFRQAVVDLLYSQSNVRNSILTQNFEHFSYQYYSDSKTDPQTRLTPLANIRNVTATVKKFIEQFDESYSNLLIYGNTGVGKTFLTNCIAKELIDSAHSVIYFTAYELFELLEQHKFNRDSEESPEKFEFILDCDLLIIDDLGTELTNSFISTQLYMCINERHLKQKSTIISTNLSFEQIKNTYSERIFSRITSDYILLKIIGEDIRLKKLF